MLRHIRYEAAFEDYLRSRGWPYLPVDEQRKAIFAGARIKTFDFLVYPPEGNAWLADVKGRKFPYDVRGGRRYWENWVTQEDLAGLQAWKRVFGGGFEPVFVFVYWLTEASTVEPSRTVHTYEGEHYALLWIPAAAYDEGGRVRSPKWGTLALPRAEFRRIAQPVDGSAAAC